jgi:hypothetical protein
MEVFVQLFLDSRDHVRMAVSKIGNADARDQVGIPFSIGTIQVDPFGPIN